MSGEASTIDLVRVSSPEDIERAVDAANAVIWEDRPVSIRFTSREEAASLGLRKEPPREGPLRLIDIEGFDVCACGGTHVARTGAVGSIAVVASERLRGGTRLTFVCGGRAVRFLRSYRDAVAGSVRVLSVLPAELPLAIERLQAESRTQARYAKELQGKLAAFEGARLAADAPERGGVCVVVASLAGWDAVGLKSVASAVTAGRRSCVVLLSAEAPTSIVVACSPGVGVDAGTVLRALVERFGGRGGGKADLAQGGGLAAPAAEVASAARALLEAELNP
jgi:alanyl-tRNA synthetase